MMQSLVVFIPGMMGSQLRENSSIGAGKLLWSENMVHTMTQVAGNPTLLQWSNNPHRPEGVLSTADVWIKKVEICRRLRDEMVRLESAGDFQYAEFSYDWRQNIFDVPQQLGQWLTKKHNFKVDADGKQDPENEPRLNLVAHSMGGLVSAIAMSTGYINPQNVRRLICIGTPFYGSPGAFRGLYSLGYLPGMEWLSWAINIRKNWLTCKKNLRHTFQSFVSTYQLLPHQSETFADVKNVGKINPLAGPVKVPPAHVASQNAVTDLHSELLAFENLLQSLPHLKDHYHFIFSEHPRNTESEYRARPSAALDTYERVRNSSWDNGDGTVLVKSATMGDEVSPSRARVVGVPHMQMCNNQDVVDLVKQYLA
jgi:pimeloyl-ACP methyl ester carboxylesterase